MKCKKAKEFLLDYADLGGDQRKSLDEHLKICPECLREYQSYKTARSLLQNNFTFKPPEDYWEKFSFEPKSYPPVFDLKSLIQDKLEHWLSLLRTPLLGPIPAYVFSFLLLIFVSFGLSSAFRSDGYKPNKLVSNLIIYEGKLLSASDDGLITIYKVSTK
jgi:hypothetical protein